MDTIDCPKCEHEHQPSGTHADDIGEMECEACGFTFIVDIDYDPSYSTRCKVHEFGEHETRLTRMGTTVECRFCVHCQMCELK